MWLKLKLLGLRCSSSRQWHYDSSGSVIQRLQESRYWGICAHNTDGVSGAMLSLGSAAQRAICAMLSDFQISHISLDLDEAIYDLFSCATNYEVSLW